MPSGEALVADARSRYGRELARINREGVFAFTELMKGVDPGALSDESWELQSRYLIALLYIQQGAGRQASLDYLTSVGVASGFSPGRARPSLAAEDRRGSLPSGLAAAALFTTVPMAVRHRVSMGFSEQEAWNKSYGLMGRAVSEAAWFEARETMTDSLKSEGIDWKSLDDDFDNARMENREREYLKDHRRMMRDKSAQQKNRMGWGSSNGDPLITRYARVPSPGACSFCLMLATKGAVYYKDSFSGGNSSSSRFNGLGGARVHRNCKCRLLAEAFPGAYEGKVFGSAADFAKAEWTDHRYERTYELKNLLNGRIVVPDLAPADVILAA
jgi:hypothetical protein